MPSSKITETLQSMSENQILSDPGIVSTESAVPIETTILAILSNPLVIIAILAIIVGIIAIILKINKK